jgi:hypothetical protein
MNLCVCYSNTEQNKIEVVVDVFERKGKGRGDLYYRHAHTHSFTLDILDILFNK